MKLLYKRYMSKALRSSAALMLILIVLYSAININMVYATSNVAPLDTETSLSPVSDPEGNTGEIGITSVYRKGMVSAGLYHTVLLNEDGRVYCWGDNSYGQLGIGTTESEDSPTLVVDLVDIVMVQAGAYHTLALARDGNVYSWGRNTFGQVGDGTAQAALKPVRIDAIPPMREIAAGAYHSLALSMDGKVYAWGNNNAFQVGDVISENITDETGNTLGKRVIKPQIVVESGAKSISAGGNHSLYLNNDGQVLAWGSNDMGQLGDGSQISRGLPTIISGLSSIIKISAGYSHNLAISESSKKIGDDQITYQNLYVWGSDSDGQLGLGAVFDENRYVDRPTRLDLTDDSNEANDRISLIQAGYSDSMITVPIIKKEKRYDSIYVWGNNTYGQLGIGDLPSQKTPVSIIATSNGWTGNVFLPFQSIAIGGYHTVFLSVKGFVGTAGRANKGQLGNVSIIDSKTPVGVAVPDAIAPQWLESDKLLVNGLSDSTLVSWPKAKDNIKVAGYVLSYVANDNQMKNIETGLENSYTIKDIDQTIPQVITIDALDDNRNKSATPLEFTYNSKEIQTNSIQESLSDSSIALNDSGLENDSSGNNLSDQSLIESSQASYDSSLSSNDGISSESESSDDNTDENSNPPDPMVWGAKLYGEIIPLEVPWSVDYVYGAGVVLPPEDYSWLVAVSITIATLTFFLFLGAVSFKRKHQGKRLFKGALKELGTMVKLNGKEITKDQLKSDYIPEENIKSGKEQNPQFDDDEEFEEIEDNVELQEQRNGRKQKNKKNIRKSNNGKYDK